MRMIFPLKNKAFILFLVLFFPTVILGQLYQSPGKDDLAGRHFGLGYYPASWQASVFADDAYVSPKEHQQNQFNLLSNALRLNYSGAEKMLLQFKTEY